MSDVWNGTPPGSDAAFEQGCTCPVIDNQHGLGAWESGGEMQYWMGEHCPLHGFTMRKEGDDE